MLWRFFWQVSDCYQCFVRYNFYSHLVIVLSAGCSPLCHLVSVRCVSAFMWNSCNCCQACTQPYFIPRIQDQLAYSKRGECSCVSVPMVDSVENVHCFRSLTAKKSCNEIVSPFSNCFSSSISHLFHQIEQWCETRLSYDVCTFVIFFSLSWWKELLYMWLKKA